MMPLGINSNLPSSSRACYRATLGLVWWDERGASTYPFHAQHPVIWDAASTWKGLFPVEIWHAFWDYYQMFVMVTGKIHQSPGNDSMIAINRLGICVVHSSCVKLECELMVRFYGWFHAWHAFNPSDGQGRTEQLTPRIVPPPSGSVWSTSKKEDWRGTQTPHPRPTPTHVSLTKSTYQEIVYFGLIHMEFNKWRIVGLT